MFLCFFFLHICCKSTLDIKCMFHSHLQLPYGNFCTLIHIQWVTFMSSEEMHLDLNVKWPLMLSNINQTWNRSMQHILVKFLKHHISHKSPQQISTCYMETNKLTDRRYKVSMHLSTVNAPKKETKKKCETKEKSWQH